MKVVAALMKQLAGRLPIRPDEESVSPGCFHTWLQTDVPRPGKLKTKLRCALKFASKMSI